MMADDGIWELQFSVEVSTRYHDWRRATLGALKSWVKVVTIVGAGLAIAGAVDGTVDWVPFVSDAQAIVIVAIANVVIAFVNVFDLAFNFDGKARDHTVLYQRFKGLQEKIARDLPRAPEKIHEWEADAQAIRQDEPPTMWAVYAICWNQTIERYAIDRRQHARKVSTLQSLVRNLVTFQPNSFPLGS